MEEYISFSQMEKYCDIFQENQIKTSPSIKYRENTLSEAVRNLHNS
jgi:hypothetical protein